MARGAAVDAFGRWRVPRAAQGPQTRTGGATARRRGLSRSPLTAPLRASSGREHRVYRFAKFRYQHRLLQHRPVTELFRSARWPVAADKEKRQIAPGDDLGDRADAARQLRSEETGGNSRKSMLH
jgi:hypothetical protein